MPFAKSIFLDILDTNDEVYLQNNTFRLEASMNDYFGVLFTGRPLPLDRNLIQINLEGFGLSKRDVSGFFTDVRINFTGNMTYEDGTVDENYDMRIDMKFFLAFDKYNETGIQGYLPLMYSDIEEIKEYNLIYQME